MLKILRSALAAAIAGGIVYAVGVMTQRYLSIDTDAWGYGACIAAASGFQIDRMLAERQLVRLADNVLLGGMWAAALFVFVESLERIFDERHTPTGTEWACLAVAVAVVAAWSHRFRSDSRAMRRRADVERAERSKEIRRQARQLVDDLATPRPDLSHSPRAE